VSVTDRGTQRLRQLRLTLASLQGQTLSREAFEVVIVDDGSAIDVERHVSDWGMDLRLRVVRQEHAGFCHAYNTGIEAARAPVVFLAVDHDILGPGSLAAHLAAHETAGPGTVSGRQRFLFHTIIFNDLTDPSAGTVNLGELATRPAMSWLPAAVEAFELDRKTVTVDDVLHHFDRLEWLAACTPEYADVEETIRSGQANKLRCGWLAMRNGSNSVATSVLRELGGFDAALDEHYGWYAELDLGLRLHAAGLPFSFAPDAVAIDLFHGPPASAGVGKSTGLAYLVAKHQCVDVALLPHYLDRVLGIAEYSRHAAEAARWWGSGR
jgi:glycosyltransferase involved in cell wall biosynthesis